MTPIIAYLYFSKTPLCLFALCTFTAGVCNRNAIVATSVSMLCPCVLCVSRRSQEQFENVKKSPGRGWSRCRCFCVSENLPSGSWCLPFSSFVFFLRFLLHPAISAIFINLHLVFENNESRGQFCVICHLNLWRTWQVPLTSVTWVSTR